MPIQVYKGVMDGVYDVAIKLLKPEAVGATDGIHNFLAEIDVLRACRDEHVVAFRGAWANEVGAASNFASLSVC